MYFPKIRFAAGLLAATLAFACAQPGPTPPVAQKKAQTLEAHGDVRVDDYYWLRERTDPDVLAYLEAENAYTEAVLADTAGLRTELFEELKNRIEPDDSTVPARYNDYYYLTRYEGDLEYPIYCRRKGSPDAPDEVTLDVNKVAEGHTFCSVRDLAVSPDSTLLAWAVDTVGRRKYTIHVTDLATGELLPDVLSEVTGNLAWANDNQTLFYTQQDPETLRAYQVWRHRMGTDADADVLIYEETDPTFSVDVWKTRSEKYIFIQSDQTLASEFRFLDADDPEAEPRIVAPRERDVEYSVDHVGDRFIIRTNLDAENFRLMEAPVATPGRDHWKEMLPGREDVFLQGVEVFQDFMVVTERRDGLRHLRIVPAGGSPEIEVQFDEPTYVTWVDENEEFDTTVLRYGYSSLNTPETIYDLDLVTGERTLMKQEQLLGGFDPANYVVERLMAPARDGVEVPVSLVYRKGLPRNGTTPLLLYGYGSYGFSMEAWFRLGRREPARPRLRLCHRPHPRRPGDGPVGGTRTASCSTRRTPSPISSTAAGTWWRRATPHPTGCSPGAAAPAAC